MTVGDFYAAQLLLTLQGQSFQVHSRPLDQRQFCANVDKVCDAIKLKHLNICRLLWTEGFHHLLLVVCVKAGASNGHNYRVPPSPYNQPHTVMAAYSRLHSAILASNLQILIVTR